MKWQLLSDLDLGVWDEEAAHSYPPQGKGIPNIAPALPAAKPVYLALSTRVANLWLVLANKFYQHLVLKVSVSRFHYD